MTDSDWPLAADIYADALELPADECARFVLDRCAGQPGLLSKVERMLAAGSRAAPDFLEQIPPALLDAVVTDAADPLERIGPWRVLREIGRGGMGQVFLAERADQQFEQQVAIKLLKRGMDSDAILARFLRERQILAGLDHPNIARLFDGGIASDGRPYFVLEYVDGQPITTYADTHRLAIDARLDLFRVVCKAVEYAHRNLIVHRDLKPSNILVNRDGHPKLLDFGIAKLLSAHDEQSVTATWTVAGSRVLTPEYAAPEQFHGGPVTTSTDVFGLGTVLYELLSGQRPFAADENRLHQPDDTEPVPLSSTVSRASARTGDEPSIEIICSARSTDPVRLRRRLRGDLDVIVARALRSVPERRYASVGALDDDVQRHLERLPIRARPDAIGYRVSRFVARHWVSVLAAATIILLLGAIGVTASLQADALERERDRARQEAAVSQQVSDFLVGVFEVADPMQTGLGDSIRARDLLARGAEQIETGLFGQPAVQARMLGVIGRAYQNLQQHDRAESLLARAVELQRATGAADSLALVTTLRQLGRVRTVLGNYPEAETVLREAAAIQQRIAPDFVATLGLSLDQAYLFHLMGDHDRGRAIEEDALRHFDQLPAGPPGGSRADLRRMVEVLENLPLKRWEDADGVFARLVAAEREAAGERSVPVATALTRWATARARQGDHAGADSLLHAASIIHAAHDPRSLAYADVLQEHGRIAFVRDDLERAESLMRSAIGIVIDRLGEDHRDVAFKRMALSFTLQRQGRIDDAIDVNRQASVVLERDENDARTLMPAFAYDLALMLRETGRLDESVVAFNRALHGFETHYAPDYLMTANVRRDLGGVLVDLGRARDAETPLRQAIQSLVARWGEEDVRVDVARISLGRALAQLGKDQEAETLLRAVLRRLTSARGEDDPHTRRARAALAQVARARAP